MKKGEVTQTPPFFIARGRQKFYAPLSYEDTFRGPTGSL
ncbi:MAG: hypothetical protein QOF64_1762 [Candidatus Binatota bacterium]|jgi:hypothetical protein|nr:hypothetical protein [Candidatus Binatota bacterium]